MRIRVRQCREGVKNGQGWGNGPKKMSGVLTPPTLMAFDVYKVLHVPTYSLLPAVVLWTRGTSGLCPSKLRRPRRL